jgi:hypothetical protein
MKYIKHVFTLDVIEGGRLVDYEDKFGLIYSGLNLIKLLGAYLGA